MRKQIVFAVIKNGGKIKPVFDAGTSIDEQEKWLKRLRSEEGFFECDHVQIWDSNGTIRRAHPAKLEQSRKLMAMPAPLPPPPSIIERVGTLEVDVAGLKDNQANNASLKGQKQQGSYNIPARRA